MSQPKRPNVLWISLEDTYPYYGCYGDLQARTPHLDRLASQGCRWEHAYSTCGVCAPARCAIITGMYAISIGGQHMRTTHTNPATPELPTPYEAVPPPHVKCFPEYLRASGYYCTNNEKTDYQFEAPRSAWNELSRKAHWRNRPNPEQPFFAVFNLGHTHESGAWPENCPEPTFDADRMVVPPYLPDTQVSRETMARLHTQLERRDEELGRLLAQLDEDGLAENTIVMHWSDHGPLPRGKRWPYDSGIRVPLIVRWPGTLEPGSVSRDLVSTIDLGPTVLSLCGLQVPVHMQGRIFLGPEANEPRNYIHASRDRHDVSYDRVRATRDSRFKYIRNYHPELPRSPWGPYRNHHPMMQELWRLHIKGTLTEQQQQLFECPRPVEELYDTEQDPHETQNLAGDPAYREDLERLRKANDHWLQEVGDLSLRPESEMVGQWWPGGKQPETSAPLFIPIHQGNYGERPVLDVCQLPEASLLQLHCATQGASIVYSFDSGDAPVWQLYSTPLRLEPGRHHLRALAIRIGYKESTESQLSIEVGRLSRRIATVNA